MTGLEPLISAREAARLLGMRRSFVTEHRADLCGIKVGSRLMFRPSDISAYVTRNQLGSAPDATPAPAPKRGRLIVLPAGIDIFTGEALPERVVTA